VRAAIGNVSRQSIDGARALGFRESAVWRFVVFPDIARQLLPPLMAFFIANVKSTSLASAIGVYEVLFVARIATGTTGRNLEAWLIVAAIYIVLIVPLGWLSRTIEHSRWMRRR
jgi:ABC-type amino acid transport system permease subunit